MNNFIQSVKNKGKKLKKILKKLSMLKLLHYSTKRLVKMTNNHIDTDCMTLTRFVLAEQRKVPQDTGDLTQLLNNIMTAIKVISSAVRKAYVAKLYDMSGETNIREVKKLDVLANELFINMLKSSYGTCLLVSEENENVIEIETDKQGKYIVCFDPLDGSSNTDCLVSIGSIFAVYRRDFSSPLSTKDALQTGRNIVAAGYGLYSVETIVVLCLGGTVNEFKLDTAIGEFVLTDPDIKIKSRRKIEDLEAAMWKEVVLEDILSKKCDTGKQIGPIVGDIQRILKHGGLFMYPATTESPKGKLRLLYQCNPMAYLFEKAGGIATTGEMPILDIVPESIHQRAPIFLGSEEDVEYSIYLYAHHAP